MTDNRRRGAMSNAAQVAREQIPLMQPQDLTDEHALRRMNNTLRRAIYSQGVWANSLPGRFGFGRFQECSAEYYRHVSI